MLSKRQSAIIWSFLVGVTLTQVFCTALLFGPRGNWLIVTSATGSWRQRELPT
jgi:hypothetical protein